MTSSWRPSRLSAELRNHPSVRPYVLRNRASAIAFGSTEGKALTTGQEWLVEIWDAKAEALKSVSALSGLFDDLIRILDLKVVGTVQWHTFPEPGGVTGLALLSESHLCIHTFPERQYAALNLYSCKERPAPEWAPVLWRWLGTEKATVREVRRGTRP